ncbi:MAG: leucine-rich repeat protein [Treponematales bacterium]
MKHSAYGFMVIFTFTLAAGSAWAQSYYTGDGGKGKSITILPPKATGLASDQAYIPGVVQGELVSNFSGYSALTVRDRQELDNVYSELFSGDYDDYAEALKDLGHLKPTDYMLGGSITKTASGYALQIKITKTGDKTTAASYSGTCTFAELETLSGVRRASLDLLQKLGVEPTERAKTELGQAATANQAAAQVALAKGIEAMKQGTVVEALSYFIQSSSADPQLAEAASRVNIVSANISSGNVGDDTRNDIKWRDAWVARLAECDAWIADYRKNTPVATNLVYSTDLKWGDTDYNRRTRPASMEVSLLVADMYWPDPVAGVANAVYAGLAATRQASKWGLNWPGYPNWGLTMRYDTALELLNDQGEVIGKQTVRLSAGWSTGFRNGKTTASYDETKTTVTFSGVPADKITDRMSIRVASLNGVNTEAASRANKVSVMTKAEAPPQWTDPRDFVIENGIITDYRGQDKDIVIPEKINFQKVTGIGTHKGKGGDKIDFVGAFQKKLLDSVVIPNGITSIGDQAFFLNELTSVVIPNSVTSIGDQAFERNQLTSVVIPSSITSIGEQAFSRNRLTSVVIPSSVTSIGEGAFSYNKLTSVVIPNSVTSIGERAFSLNELTSVVIPSSITSIGEGAFFGNRLTSVVIPNSVTFIGRGVFASIAKGKDYGYSNSFSISISLPANVEFPKGGGKDSLMDFYNKNGKKAGTYRWDGKKWGYSAER